MNTQNRVGGRVPANKPVIIIEHCETGFSPWLLLEYRHASMIYGRDYLWFTNVSQRYHGILSRYGRVLSESVVKLVESGVLNPNHTIVLDPKADQALTFEDLLTAGFVVIGGILGDHPPRGRTWLYITSRMPPGVRAFNIGGGQYSIDGAVYYVDYMWRNKGIEGFKYVDGVVIKTDFGEVYLPFRYPVVNGKPLLADGLEYYLKYRRLRDDIWAEITGSK